MDKKNFTPEFWQLLFLEKFDFTLPFSEGRVFEFAKKFHLELHNLELIQLAKESFLVGPQLSGSQIGDLINLKDLKDFKDSKETLPFNHPGLLPPSLRGKIYNILSRGFCHQADLDRLAFEFDTVESGQFYLKGVQEIIESRGIPVYVENPSTLQPNFAPFTPPFEETLELLSKTLESNFSDHPLGESLKLENKPKTPHKFISTSTLETISEKKIPGVPILQPEKSKPNSQINFPEKSVKLNKSVFLSNHHNNKPPFLEGKLRLAPYVLLLFLVGFKMFSTYNYEPRFEGFCESSRHWDLSSEKNSPVQAQFMIPSIDKNFYHHSQKSFYYQVNDQKFYVAPQIIEGGVDAGDISPLKFSVQVDSQMKNAFLLAGQLKLGLKIEKWPLLRVHKDFIHWQDAQRAKIITTQEESFPIHIENRKGDFFFVHAPQIREKFQLKKRTDS